MQAKSLKKLNIAVPIAKKMKPSQNLGFWMNKALKEKNKPLPFFPEMMELFNLNGSQILDLESISKHLVFKPDMDYSRELKKLKVSLDEKLEEVKVASVKICFAKDRINKVQERSKVAHSHGGRKRKRRRKKDLDLQFKVTKNILQLEPIKFDFNIRNQIIG